jgi:hypothetical protein
VASASTSTVIRYSTTTYPATPADGTSVSTPILTLNHCLQTGLVAGTTYYYSAWGYDGANYSGTVANLVMTTLAADTSISGGDVIPPPTIDTNPVTGWFRAPDHTKLSKFEPFYSLINNFVADWQMPVESGWIGFALIITALLSIAVYIKFKEIFVSLAVSETMLFFFAAVGLVQPWMLAIPIVIGMGVWSIERSFQ